MNLLLNPGRRLALLAVFVLLQVGLLAPAPAQETTRNFNIVAQPLSQALIEFSKQSDLLVVADAALVKGKRSPAVRGTMTPGEAMNRLLVGSGLAASQRPEGGYLIAAGIPTAAARESDPPAESETLAEIIVTARKREETLQNVPASVTALGGTALSRIGAQGFEDFVRLVPGLTMVPTSTNPNFSIRGVSTSTTLGTTQAPIALYVDDTPTQDPFVALSSTNLYLADISRVEVLRGPQGTLFGSGSLSGAIRVITRKPDPGKFSGYVEAGFDTVQGGDNGHQFEAMVNVPLGETTALRAVAYDRRSGGFMDNTLRNQENTNGSHIVGGRVALGTVLADKLSLTGTLMYQKDTTDDGARSFYTPSQGSSRQWASLVADGTRFATTIGNILASYDLGWASLTSSSSYLHRRESTILDASPDLSPLLGVPNTPVFSDNDNISKNFVEELRLTSQLQGPVNFVAGAYYSNAQRHTHTFVRAPVLEGFIGLQYLLEADLHSRITEAALFGDVTWAVSNTVELSAGVRAFHNKVQVEVANNGLLIGPPVALDRVNNDTSATPRFTATWRPNKDLTLYVQAAQGYRLGQANVAAGPPLYESDTLWNFELGAKGLYFGDRLQLNVAAFDIEWKNLQVGLRPPGTLFLYTGNAGRARSVGLELEGLLRLTKNLDFQTSMSFDDAKLTESIPNLPQPSGVVGVQDGDRMPGVPRFTISNALIFSHPVGSGASVRARVDHQYVGRAYNTFSRAGALEIGDYHVFNVSAGMDFGTLSVDLVAKNVGNSDGIANANFDLGLDVLRAAWRLPPRSIGIVVRKSF